MLRNCSSGNSGRHATLAVARPPGDARRRLDTASCDGVVMAYGLRNPADPAAGLAEIHRLLKPGGRAGVLDFNRLPVNSAAAAFQRFYLRRWWFQPRQRLGSAMNTPTSRKPQAFSGWCRAGAYGFGSGFKPQHRPLVAGQMGLLLLKR